MGNPVDLRYDPIFICEKIYDKVPGLHFDFHGRVVVGREGGCSYYTKAILIETSDDLDNDKLDELRMQLKKMLDSGPR